MPLPEKSFQYLGSAIATLRREGGIINLQNFTHAGKGTNPKKESRSQLETKLQNFRCKHSIEDERVIRPVGPGWYQVAHDIKIIST
jgi:tRNA G37 N-methylase Trm5